MQEDKLRVVNFSSIAVVNFSIDEHAVTGEFACGNTEETAFTTRVTELMESRGKSIIDVPVVRTRRSLAMRPQNT